MSHDPLEMMLRSFRLPTMASLYQTSLQEAEKNDWGYRKFLLHLCESESQDRQERRVTRLLKQSGLPEGKSHYLAAIGREMVLRHQYRTLFIPTFKLVQQLLNAKKELRLEEALKKLDRYELVILDDIGYVQQNREEMDVLFTFLAERYERRSVMITSNLVFSKWDQIFKDPMTTMAAIDRLVHHSIILEFTGESVRNRKAKEKNKD